MLHGRVSLVQPSLISLTPTVIELTQFIQQNWSHVWWYPNWFLGVPLRFVTGPLVPGVLISLKYLLPYFSLQHLYQLLIIVSWGFGGIGLYLFLNSLLPHKKYAQIAVLGYFLLPFHLFLLSFGNGLGHIAISLVPWAWCSWQTARTVTERKFILNLITVCIITTVLLVNLSTFFTVVIGLLLLTIFGARHTIFPQIIELICILLSSLLLATMWYSPTFWWVLLTNPSFGGKPLYQVISWLLQLVQALIPITLGFWIGKWNKRTVTHPLVRFGFFFGLSFGFLTLIRFVSDPDFWMDWTGYLLEMQIAVAISFPYFMNKYSVLKSRIVNIFIAIILVTVNGFIYVKLYHLTPQQKYYQSGVAELVSRGIKSNERIFLSGSSVFWLGANQVRGGKEYGSIHRTWADAAYQIREGEKSELAENWFEILGVSYALVHERESQEYFIDYKNTERFHIFEKIDEFEGNSLYKTPGNMARIADKVLLDVKKPKAGNDADTLKQYVELLKAPLEADLSRPNQVIVNADSLVQDDVISLAISAHPNWKLVEGEGKITRDTFGNLAIIPKSSGKFVLEYHERWFSSILAGVAGVVLLILSNFSHILAGKLRHHAPSLDVTEKNEEEEY